MSRAPAQATPTPTPPLDIRRVATWPEYRACVELQREVWGGEFSDQVPASLLSVAQRIGGVTAGAFEPDGRLVGFVFGMSGVENGRPVHWSDLLAVRADARDRGIGRQLKLFQRDLVRSMGATKMYWTYDPLVARNAYLNIMTLGAKPVEYVQDMYGSDSGSFLHRGIGTDRFIVAWMLDEDLPSSSGAPSPKSRRVETRDDEIPLDQIALLNRTTLPPGPVVSRIPPDPEGMIAPLVGVAIPLDIQEVKQASLEEAIRWRSETRECFQWAFANGYRVKSFRRVDATKTGLYVLSSSPTH